MISPRSLLLPYQLDWVQDDSRFKIGMWSRQTGKSFSTAEEAVNDCLSRKTTWVTLSAGERQALEWMRKAHEWADAYKFTIADYAEDRDTAEALLKNAETVFPNGSRIIAIPANPATARGYSANLTLDEFAHHEDPDAIWKAVYPSISNPLKGIYKIRIVSTPNGMGNKFHDLWTKNNKWSKRLVDIYEAVKRGLPVNIDELKEGLDDPEAWAQEYECLFIDSSSVLLTYEVIAGCESAELSETVESGFWDCRYPFPLFMGLDFGRKRDLSVAWTAADVGADILVTKEIFEMDKVSTPEQFRRLKPRVRQVQRVCVDYTGPGVGLGDLLVEEFGEYKPEENLFGKVELCNLTQPFKQQIFPKLQFSMAKGSLRVPVSRKLREDLHSVQRISSANGGTSYRAPHSPDGHADRCTAAALLVRAKSTGSGLFNYQGIVRRIDAALRRQSENQPRTRRRIV